MAMVKCKECGGAVSTKADTCPKCGAKQPKRTTPLAWFALALILFAVTISVFVASEDRHSASTQTGVCGPIALAALGLPDDKAEARADFVAKAQRLNGSGKCVIEGGFGRSYEKFYFAVRDGPNGKPYFLRFSREELARN